MSDAPDEFRLIADLFAPLARDYPGALGLTDDAALVSEEPGLDLVATMDAVVAGVHFLPDDPADLVARKLVRVNLSDLAAKGARPVAVMMAAAFPKDVTMEWLTRFAAGLGDDLRGFGVSLIGGDTVSTPGPLTLSLTALGRVERGRALLRSGARPGDRIWVSGTLGDGAIGLLAAQGRLADLSSADQAILTDRYRLPRPRVALGLRLVGVATAAMDISDGLIQDLGHLCRASGVGAEIEADHVPLSPSARAAIARDPALASLPLTGGDDYEILFTAPPSADNILAHITNEIGIPLTLFGRVVKGDNVVVRDGKGNVIIPGPAGWRHFTATTVENGA